LKVMFDTDDEETQIGQRPWLPPSRGAGRGRGLLAASQWSPDSAEAAVERTTLVDTVPMGYGRPRGDATTCPMDESMTSHPTVIEPGQAGRGGGGWVIQAFTISLTVDKLRKPRFQSSKHIDAKQNLTQMSIKQCLESVEMQ